MGQKAVNNFYNNNTKQVSSQNCWLEWFRPVCKETIAGWLFNIWVLEITLHYFNDVIMYFNKCWANLITLERGQEEK